MGLRLFIAVDVPEDRRSWLDDALAPLRAEIPARWIPVENQHVTIRFLGSVEEERVPEISAILKEVAATLTRADIALNGLGAFPNRRRARVLWAGLSDPEDLLGTMARALEGALRPLGFEPERRSFTAHLTLARLAAPRNLATAWPQDLPSGPPPPWTVDHVGLWRSHLSPKGARYEILAGEYLGRP